MSDLGTVCERHGNKAAGWVLQARLADLAAYNIECRCACGQVTKSAVKLIVSRLGGDHRLADFVDRVTCKHCGRPYGWVYFNETHHREFSHGAPPGWSVQLRPFPTVQIEAAE